MIEIILYSKKYQPEFKRLNLELSDGDITRFYDEVSLCLENEDLGKAFYEKEKLKRSYQRRNGAQH